MSKLKNAPKSTLTLFGESLRAAAVAAEALLADETVARKRRLAVAHLIGLARYLGREYQMILDLDHAQPSISMAEIRGHQLQETDLETTD